MGTETRDGGMSGTEAGDGADVRENRENTDTAAADETDPGPTDETDQTTSNEPDPAAERCGISLGKTYDE